MALTTEVLVVGGGVAGLASAWHLARAGREVLVVESAEQPGVHSSGQNAAILRSLIADVDLTRIGRAAAERLHRPPAGFADTPLVRPHGLVLAADPAGREALLAWPDTMPAPPYPECRAEVLTARELERVLPPFAPLLDPGDGFDDPVALYLPDEGELDVAALVEAFATGARSASSVGGRDARILCGAEVARLATDPTSGAVTGVELRDGRRVVADQVLLASGAWAGAMAAEVGSPMAFAPKRRTLAVGLSSGPPVDATWPVVWNQGTDFYARPESGGMLLCGCDETLLEPAGPPSAGGCPRDEAALELVAERTALFLPAFADARVGSFWSGWRTFTETGDASDGRHPFAIGPDPAVPSLFWAAGLGGHGMTSSFEVGRLAAVAVLEARGQRLPAELEGEDYGSAFLPRAAATPA